MLKRSAAAFFLSSALAAKVQNFELEIPKVTIEELEGNASLKSGVHAYVIKDFFKDKWKAANWTLDYLKKRIPFEWVDFYPENMKNVGNKPYLFKFSDALPRFLQPSQSPRYMQLRVSYRGWNRLVKDFQPLPLPDVFWSDEEWIGKCMQKSSGEKDKKAIDNFYTTQQWKFLLIGEKDTEMFFHKDGTAASSWQAQLKGRKSWTLCPNSESQYLSVHIDTYNPDYKRFPQFAKAKCGRVMAEEGDLLYYPAYWWHHPKQYDTPTISYTGALVGVEADRDDVGSQRKVHKAFLDDLKDKCSKCWTPGNPQRQCDDISEKWPGAAPPMMRVMCDEYLPKCYKLWDKHGQAANDFLKAAKAEGKKSEL